MNDDERRQEADGERDFEERLRELLAEDAYTIRPSPAPYPAIRRRGVVERRRRVAAAGAALVTLAAMPVGAYALSDGGPATSTAASPTPSASASRSLSPTPSGTTPPAVEGQLFDGITAEQAADGLANCLDSELSNGRSRGEAGLDPADEYAIVLAMRSTGDSNAPGDGMYVVAATDAPQQAYLICNLKDGVTQGISAFTDESDIIPDEGPVLVNPNGGKLYQQSFLDRGNWKLPFRWGVVGTVKPSVARVTVTYGGSDAEATLTHGRFVASGVLNEQVTLAPHIKGYDAAGKLIYDSDEDKYYERTLP